MQDQIADGNKTVITGNKVVIKYFLLISIRYYYLTYILFCVGNKKRKIKIYRLRSNKEKALRKMQIKDNTCFNSLTALAVLCQPPTKIQICIYYHQR